MMSKADRRPHASASPSLLTDASGGKSEEAGANESSAPSSGAPSSEPSAERPNLSLQAVKARRASPSILTSTRTSRPHLEGPLVNASAKSSPRNSPAFTSTGLGRLQERSSKLSVLARRLKVRFGKVSFREYTASVGTAMRQKRGRTIATIAMTTAAIGAMVLLLMLSSVPRKEVVTTERCDTEECMRAFYYLERAGDLLEDPCHDFYRYVCHRWQENGDLVQLSVSHFYDRLDNNMRFDSALELGSETGALLFARAYRSCHQFLSSPVDAYIAQRVLDRLKSVVQRFSATSTMDKLIEEIVRTSVIDGIDVLLHVSLAVHENDTYPIITPGRSLREKLSSRFQYHLVIDIVKPLFPLSRATFSEVVEIDAFIHKALSGKEPKTQRHALNTMSNLTPLVTPSLWSSLLKKFLNASDVAAVLVTDADKIQNVTTHLGKVLKRTEPLQTYLSLQAVADVLLFIIQKRLHNAEDATVARNCLQTICLVMSHFCAHVTSHVFGWSNQTKRTVESIYDSALKQYVNSGSLLWRRAGNWSLLSEGLNATRLVQLPSEFTDVAEEGIAHYKARLKEWPDSFLELYLVLLTTHRAVSIKLPLHSTQRYVIKAYLKGLILQSDLLSGLLVPTALTSAHLLYSSSVPIELNLGTMGALIANSLVLAHTPAHGGSIWTDSMRHEFKVKTTCLFKLHSNLMINKTTEWHETTASMLFAWTLSVQLALGSLLSAEWGILSEDKQHQWAAQRTLLRRFCLLSCGADEGETPEAAFSARSRCLVPLVGLYNFAEVFSCPLGSPMNPIDGCHRDSPPALATSA